jgi:hypothetical protein
MRFRQWLPQVLLALGMVAILLTFPAQASPCVPLSIVLSKIGEDTRLVEMRVLEGKKLAPASEIFNSQPPESDIPWGAGYFAVRTDGYALLILGFEDHVCVSMTFSPDGVRRFLNQIDGVTA